MLITAIQPIAVGGQGITVTNASLVRLIDNQPILVNVPQFTGNSNNIKQTNVNYIVANPGFGTSIAAANVLLGRVGVPVIFTAVQQITVPDASLAIVAGLAGANTQPIVNAIIANPGFGAVTATAIGGLNLTFVANAIAANAAVTSARLQALVSAPAIAAIVANLQQAGGTQAVVNAIVTNPNFDAAAANAMLAVGINGAHQITLAMLQTAISSGAVNAAGLAALAHNINVNSVQAAVQTIIQNANLNAATVAALSAGNIAALIGAIIATPGLPSSPGLQVIAGDPRVCATQAAVNALVAAANFDAAAAAALVANGVQNGTTAGQIAVDTLRNALAGSINANGRLALNSAISNSVDGQSPGLVNFLETVEAIPVLAPPIFAADNGPQIITAFANVMATTRTAAITQTQLQQVQHAVQALPVATRNSIALQTLRKMGVI